MTPSVNKSYAGLVWVGQRPVSLSLTRVIRSFGVGCQIHILKLHETTVWLQSGGWLQYWFREKHHVFFRVRGNKEEYNLYLDHPGSIFGSPSVFQNFDPGAIRAWGLARPTPVPRPLEFHLGSGRRLGLWSSQYMSGQKRLYKKELSFPLLKNTKKTCFITHRIHGAGIYANIKGVYWWDPCYHIYSSTMDPMGDEACFIIFHHMLGPEQFGAFDILRPLGPPWCRARRVLQLLGCGPPVSLNLSTGENGTGRYWYHPCYVNCIEKNENPNTIQRLFWMSRNLSHGHVVPKRPKASKSTRRLDWLDWFWTIGFPWLCHWISSFPHVWRDAAR